MNALIKFLAAHLTHSTLVDSMEKEGLQSLLKFAEEELTALTARVAKLEDATGTTPPASSSTPASTDQAADSA